MSYMMQPTILLLREGTDTSQGKGQVISNINACEAVVNMVRTTLGPRGMDKLIVTGSGDSGMLITNDGATVLNHLDIVHPAARTLVDISKSQDTEVGDGTTSVVILAGALLTEAKLFVEDGLHPQVIVRGYRKAAELAKQRLSELSVSISSESESDNASKQISDEKTNNSSKSGFSISERERAFLEKCAATALQSKLVAGQRGFFARLIVDAVVRLGDVADGELFDIKKVPGGSLEDSFLLDGVAFEKTFSYAGFEQQPKHFDDAKVLCLNMELELKAERDNAEIRIDDVTQYQSFVDAEWKIIYSKLDAIAASGANIVLSKLAIGDLATQYFADRGIFCAGRVGADDLLRVCKATGAAVQTTVSNLVPSVLGSCGRFEEAQIGDARYNLFSGCPGGRSSTLVLRGGGAHFIDEAERSLHDAVMVVRRARANAAVVAGGGAVEMELGKWLHEKAMAIAGKEQLVVDAFATALEVIPRQLADNAGYDSTLVLNQLRQKHAEGGCCDGGEAKWFGVNMETEGICDTFAAGVWEPTLVKMNAITAATEAACVILSVDETIKNTPSQPADAANRPAMPVRR